MRKLKEKNMVFFWIIVVLFIAVVAILGRKMYMNCLYEIRIRSLDVRQSQQMEKQ